MKTGKFLTAALVHAVLLAKGKLLIVEVVIIIVINTCGLSIAFVSLLAMVVCKLILTLRK